MGLGTGAAPWTSARATPESSSRPKPATSSTDPASGLRSGPSDSPVRLSHRTEASILVELTGIEGPGRTRFSPTDAPLLQAVALGPHPPFLTLRALQALASWPAALEATAAQWVRETERPVLQRRRAGRLWVLTAPEPRLPSVVELLGSDSAAWVREGALSGLQARAAHLSEPCWQALLRGWLVAAETDPDPRVRDAFHQLERIRTMELPRKDGASP